MVENIEWSNTDEVQPPPLLLTQSLRKSKRISRHPRKEEIHLNNHLATQLHLQKYSTQCKMNGFSNQKQIQYQILTI